MSSPDFATLGRLEERLLLTRLDTVRASITHPGEKGRALERVVHNLLRDFLPAEYGLSTGFVVWNSPEGPRLSPQLDIIIYDALRSAPLVTLEACEVFPLEAVYGYVEVKASLRSSDASAPPDNSIEECVRRNHDVREMNIRWYWVPGIGSPSSFARVPVPGFLALRSFIVAFEPAGTVASDLSALARRMALALKRAGNPAHLHGVFIPNHGLLSTRPVDASVAKPEDYFHVLSTGEHALLAFKALVLQHLATFPRPKPGWVAAVDQYFALEWEWFEHLPPESDAKWPGDDDDE